MLALVESYDRAVYHSKLYNSPAFFDAPVPAGERGYPAVGSARTLAQLTDAWFDDDPFRLEGEAKGKLVALKDARKWSTNVGHPGPASPAVGEVYSTFILPNMMAAAAQGMPAAQAVAQAEKQIRTIFNNWRQRGLIGGSV